MTTTNTQSGIYTYDGSALADSEDVIVVTINYRTNGQNLSHMFPRIWLTFFSFWFPSVP